MEARRHEMESQQLKVEQKTQKLEIEHQKTEVELLRSLLTKEQIEGERTFGDKNTEDFFLIGLTEVVKFRSRPASILWLLIFFGCLMAAVYLTCRTFMEYSPASSAPVHLNATIDCIQCINEWRRNHPQLANRFQREHLCLVCEARRKWEDGAANGLVPSGPGWSPDQAKYMEHLQQCHGRACLELIGSDRKALRKEYRIMTDFERHQFHKALNQLKMQIIGNLSKYDLFVSCHRSEISPGAHWGAAFLPFHREYLKQFEIAIREINPNISLPYWDSTLDQGLPDPSHSVLWTPEFMGTAKGNVDQGPFAGWLVYSSDGANSCLTRDVGGNHTHGLLYQPSDIEAFLNFTSMKYFDACFDDYFEVAHGTVHIFVGGHMANIPSSPNDPLFILHHSFIDYIWEEFRQTRQNSWQRVNDYSPDDIACTNLEYSKDFRRSHARMRPFPIINIAGLSEAYVNELYHYDSHPVCKPDGNGCVPNSPYLFCNRQQNRCLSKIRLRGNCCGLETEDSCYNGTCKGGICT